ncbi:hypothetical protein HPP92_021522 [Vanilla planifolia]|uniref:Uncharacterized protein n=1 Tax=Vanilla planifolia TaxID=51239 RepID=A0A835UKT7_VANPL|nr:hypothetical protein HPP92_021887 [Vanilla planifolia]KAG0463046.1 hypothetical protein HPP92_021522 [Vanilla planifolia]
MARSFSAMLHANGKFSTWAAAEHLGKNSFSSDVFVDANSIATGLRAREESTELFF